MKKISFLCLLFLMVCFSGFAQLQLPQSSPKAVTMQTIGLTDITVTYHTPSVKGRDVWGKLVPYGQVWRSGANEATLITFSDAVKINGKALPAGTYSLFTLPEQNNNWQLIFNKNTTLWGTEGYKAEEDILRVPVTAKPWPFQETLQYTFSNIGPTSGTLNLSWEKLTIPFTIEVEVFNKALTTIKTSLAGAKNEDWSIFAQAAQFLIQNNTEHELALEWINKSLNIRENFLNSWYKAQLLAQKNEFQEAINLTRKAVKLGEKDPKNFTPLAPQMEVALNEWKVKLHQND